MSLYIKCTSDYTTEYYTNTISNQHNDDSGLDLVIPNDITIPKQSFGTKIYHEINCQPSKLHGYYLYPRSSISKTTLRLANSVGIIDYGYRGDIIACVDNIGNEDVTIKKGTRLFQICFPDLKPFKFELNRLENHERGESGFGSTGN